MQQHILKQRRKELGFTLDYIAKKIGVTEATVQRWESGNIKNLRQGRLVQLAKILEISPTELMGWDTSSESEFENIPEGYAQIPLIDISAPMKDKNLISNKYLKVQSDYLIGHKKEDYFAIEICDDSMFPHYQKGDKVLILKQSHLDYSGQTAAVVYFGNINLRRVELNGENKISLIPINPNIAPERPEDDTSDGFKLIGIPKLLLRKL